MIQLSMKSIHDIDQMYSWSIIIGRSVNLGERFTSPFRLDDTTPDCTLYEKNGIIRFSGWSVKDKVYNGYGCIDAYMHLRGMSYSDAINELYRKSPITKKQVPITTRKEKQPLTPFVIPYTPQGLLYWRELGVDITSDKRVAQIEGFRQYNDTYFPINEVAFTYIYNERYKTYRPFAENKKDKWKSSIVKDDTWFVNNNAEITLICKSAKCQLVLESLLKTKYNYTHPQSESQILNIPNSIAIMDNDEAGKIAIREYTKLGIKSLCINDASTKDISDYIKLYGRAKLFKLIYTMMERKKYLVLHPESEFQLVEDWNKFLGVDWNLERITKLLETLGFKIVQDKEDVKNLIEESKNEIDNVYWFYVPENRNNIAIQVDIFIHSVTIRNLDEMYHILKSFNSINLKDYV